MTTDFGSKIYYTTDKSEPTKSSNLYNGEIDIKKSTTLKYINVNELGQTSEIYTKEYSIFEIYNFDDRDTSIRGKADKGTTVNVVVNGKSFSSIANADDTFNVEVGKLNEGDNVRVKLSNDNGLESEELSFTVKDKTPPKTPIVETEITNEQREITIVGKAEPLSTIKLKVNSRVVLTTQADEQGKFEFGVYGIEEGSKIEITSTDASGNESTPYRTTVKDVIPPSMPISDREITTNTTNIDVKAENNSTVYIAIDGKVIGQGKVPSYSNNCSISVYKKLPTHNRATVQIVAVDNAGNVSEILEKKIKDETRPEIIEVNTVTSKESVISGKSEPYATVEATLDNGVKYTSIVDKDGNFEIEVGSLKNIRVANFTVEDEIGLKSYSSYRVNIKDLDEPELTDLEIAINETYTYISGYSSEGAKLVVKQGDNIIMEFNTDYRDDKYRVHEYTSQKFDVGTKFTVQATDYSGNKSKVYELTLKDKISPTYLDIDSNTVNDNSTSINGKTEANATVVAFKYYNGSNYGEIARAKASSDGTFKIKLEEPLKAGTEVGFNLIDESGNESYNVGVITVKDVTPPKKPIVNELTNNDEYITGEGEYGTYMVASINGKIIGYYELQHGDYFQIKLDNKLKEYTEVYITPVDKANHIGESVKLVVKDVIAPDVAPTINQVTNEDTFVTGKAEPFATVYVEAGPDSWTEGDEWTDWRKIGKGQADKNGNYKIQIPKLKVDFLVKVYQADQAGNMLSWVTRQTRVVDIHGPKKPTVNYLTDSSKEIKITSEPNSSIEIFVDGKSKGSYWVDHTGKVTINIQSNPTGIKLTAGAVVKIVPKDDRGNIGEALEIKVAKSITDISNHWAKAQIQDFIEKGYIGGYSDGTFRPNNNITRAEFVKILNKAFGLTKSSGKVFIDTKNHWAKDEIDIAVTNGIASGISSTEFKPNDPITREQAAVMVSNYKKLSDNNHDKLNKYNDASQVSSWAKDSVEGVIEKGYMSGYSDNTFRPKNKITRAEAVVTLSRIK